MPLDKVVVDYLGNDAPTEEEINSKVGEMLARNDALETDNQGLKEECGELKKAVAELEALKPKSELGERYLADTREAALAAYRKVKGENASDGMIKTIENADLEQAKALRVEFEGEVEKRFPLKCAKCGATQLSRRSSEEGSAGEYEGPSEEEIESYKTGGE